MKIFYSPLHQLHSPNEFFDGKIVPSPEKPERAEAILKHLVKIKLGEVLAPTSFNSSHYKAAHSPDFVDFLESFWHSWQQSGKSGQASTRIWPASDHTPMPKDIEAKLGVYSGGADAVLTATSYEAIKASADVALSAAQSFLADNKSVFALCRPPGHHAGKAKIAGFCYLNNIAIAARYLQKSGIKKIAILDLDYHHGNGTQDIFYEDPNLLFISIHGEPSVTYPFYTGYTAEKGAGPGYGFNLNFPLPHGTNWQNYEPALISALAEIVNFAPECILISLGVDGYKDDPISRFKLETDDYRKMAMLVKAINIPTMHVMEGGYNIEMIGENVAAFLTEYS